MGEATLIKRFGSVLRAVVDPLDVVLLRPEITSSMADAIISAVVTSERSRRRVTRCAKTEGHYADRKYPWIAVATTRHHRCMFDTSRMRVAHQGNLPKRSTKRTI